MRFLFLILFLVAGLGVFARQPDSRFTDSLQRRLAGAKTPKEKIQFLLLLAMVSTDSTQAENYATQAITTAELNRDRRLIAFTYIQSGARYMNVQGLEGNLDKAQRAFEHAGQVAKENGLSRLQVEAYYWLSNVLQVKGDNQKALAYSNQALALASNSDNDTMKVMAFVTMGEVYRQMKQMPLSFQNFSEALTLAEANKDPDLLRSADMGFSHFYADMHEFGKAIDYTMKIYRRDRASWDAANMLMDLYRLGDLFGNNHQQDVALTMYQHSLLLADTLHYDLFKINSYFRIFSMYYQSKEYVKGFKYMQGQREMLEYLDHLGFGFFLGVVKAMAFSEAGKLDSAEYYFRASQPNVLARGSYEMRYEFYQSFGDFYSQKRDYRAAIALYRKAFEQKAAEGDLESEESTADSLQAFYERVGDYPSALAFNRLAQGERDSLRAQTQETELMKLEVDTENRRKEREARAEELNTEHRHNIQYMGFTVGLVLLFITIVLLGRLTVPVSVIRTVVFLSFIFLFEFIILLLDHTIQAWTQEEPWKVLCIKIVLAAGLVPLHHWLEHRVIHYLSHRRRPTAAVAVHKEVAVQKEVAVHKE
ncbi:tetratricopeptide repeat protein [Puia sp.]|uniref:tetratricopeptide repeat protein n=1 Tax=Puia sp. TaxID=2045100 RepID=UPI002F400052